MNCTFNEIIMKNAACYSVLTAFVLRNDITSKQQRITMSTQPVSESPEKAFESRDVMAVIPRDGVKRALLIAAGSFNDVGIPSLDGVDPDVALIRDRLLDSRCGFKPENVVVLESRHSPSLKKIKQALDDFLRLCRPNDFIFLYFAGHGFRCADVDYYVPCDAKPIFEADKTVSFEASSCFSFKYLRERIGACSAKFKWVIVDACRTNHTARDVFDGDLWNSIGELKAAKGSLWFQSCGLNQKSYEIKFIENGQTKNHGLFTWYFCEGAKGKAADKFGKISPRTLFNYACKKIQDECGGNCAIRQQPLFSCDDLSSDNFVFVDLSEAPAYRAKRLYDEASALCVGGKYEQAQEKIGEAIKIEPNNTEYKKLEVRVKVGVHINKGLRYFPKHKYAEAKREAELALELDPENQDALALKEAANNPASKPVPTEPIRPPKVESEPKRPRKVDRAAAAIIVAFMTTELCLWLSDSSRRLDNSLLPNYEEAIKDGEVVVSPPVEVATSVDDASVGSVPSIESDGDESKLELREADFKQTEPGSRAVLTYNGIEFAFRYCPSGSFTMGSPSDEEGRYDDETQREVNIGEGFWIFETETTQEQWDAVGVKKEEECIFKGANLPVGNVSWNESDSFIKELNSLNVAPAGWRFALPSEEQWEYVCRAGTTGSTYGVPLDDAAWYKDNSGDKPHEVGTKKPNKWGVYDMLGNVLEWTSSKYEGGSWFVFRSSCWDIEAQFCRPASRGAAAPTFCLGDLGFRAVLVRSK